MRCKYCGRTGKLFLDSEKKLLIYRCDFCHRNSIFADKQTIELYRFRQKLLDESNHSHNAFVFQLIHEQKRISTIELLQHCAAAYISNGDREARTLKTKGLLDNYKPPGKKYVVWFEKSLVA